MPRFIYLPKSDTAPPPPPPPAPTGRLVLDAATGNTATDSANVDDFLNNLLAQPNAVDRRGHILGGQSYKVGNLSKIHFTKSLDITFDDGTTFDGENSLETGTNRGTWFFEAAFKMVPANSGATLTWRNWGTWLTGAPNAGEDMRTRTSYWGNQTPAWNTDVEYLILHGMSWIDVTQPLFLCNDATGQTFNPDSSLSRNPAIKTVHLKDITAENCLGGFFIVCNRLGQDSGEIAVREKSAFPSDGYNVIIEDFSVKNVDGTGMGQNGTYAGEGSRAFYIGPKHNTYQKQTGAVLIRNGTMENIYDNRNKDNGYDGTSSGIIQGPEVQGIRMTGVRGALVENITIKNVFSDARGVAHTNQNPAREGITANCDSFYAKSEDLVFRDSEIINCGFGEGCWTSKSGKDPDLLSDSLEPGDPELDAAYDNQCSGRRVTFRDTVMRIDESQWDFSWFASRNAARTTFPANDVSPASWETRAVRCPSHISTSGEVTGITCIGWPLSGAHSWTLANINDKFWPDASLIRHTETTPNIHDNSASE